MSKRWDVAVAGEIFADHVLSGFARWPEPGEELFTDAYVREAGGGAAITACALGRLGRSVAIFGVAGSEDGWLAQRLHDCGVALDALRLVEQSTAVTVSVSTREDRTFFSWPGANRELGAYLRDPATLRQLAQARHVHFAVALDRGLAQTVLPPLREAGCTLSIDPGHHPEWLAAPQNWETCAACDIFLPNEKEGALMTGKTHPEAMLSTLQSFGIAGTVLKLWAQGAATLVEGSMQRAQPLLIPVVDTTGAGDAFDAGLIDALLDGVSMIEAMRRACICGSLSTRQAGAIAGLPAPEELHAYAANIGKP